MVRVPVPLAAHNLWAGKRVRQYRKFWHGSRQWYEIHPKPEGMVLTWYSRGPREGKVWVWYDHDDTWEGEGKIELRWIESFEETDTPFAIPFMGDLLEFGHIAAHNLAAAEDWVVTNWEGPIRPCVRSIRSGSSGSNPY